MIPPIIWSLHSDLCVRSELSALLLHPAKLSSFLLISANDSASRPVHGTGQLLALTPFLSPKPTHKFSTFQCASLSICSISPLFHLQIPPAGNPFSGSQQSYSMVHRLELSPRLRESSLQISGPLFGGQPPLFWYSVLQNRAASASSTLFCLLNSALGSVLLPSLTFGHWNCLQAGAKGHHWAVWS